MLPVSPFPALIAAGAINASFALPMKFMRKWAWENVWLVWSLFALLAFPIVLSGSAISGLVALYVSTRVPVFQLVLIGTLWGVGQVLFGIALEAIGISLATAIMLGISLAVGTLLPLVWVNGQRLTTMPVVALTTGIALAVSGVILCARAGQNREFGKQATGQGIGCAVAAGFGAGLFNLLMTFGRVLIERAVAAGCPPAFAQLAAWTPFLAAGAMANVGYCVFRLVRRRTFGHFVQRGATAYWLGGMLMAALWLGSALLYGTAVRQMGPWGTVLGWPVYMSLIVLGTAGIGMVAGEWHAASLRTMMTMTGGLTVLVAAVFLISSVSRYF